MVDDQLFMNVMSYLLYILFICCPFLAVNAWAETISEHEVAIVEAREGKLEEALRKLERLESSTSDTRVRDDLMVVLGWAGRHEHAVHLWARTGWTLDLPEYVRLGLSNSLHSLSRDAEKKGQRFDAMRYLGHAQRLAFNNYSEAALQKSAEQSEADVIRLMGELGGHQGAMWRVRAATLQQRADRVALRLRIAKHLGQATGPERKRRLEEITEELTVLISEVQNATLINKRLLHQLWGDRAVAFVERQLWSSALEDIEAAGTLDLPLWPYIQMAKGAALLGLQRPDQARAIYEAVLAEQPDNVGARWGLFYAWADQGAHKPATKVMDKTASDRWRRVGLDARNEQDLDWLPARLASARVRSWDEQQSAAWQQLKELSALVPDDASIILAQASVAAARGWPRLAEQNVRSALTLDESSLAVRLALAESTLRRNQWSEFRLRSDLLEGLESSERDRLERESRLRRGWHASFDHQRRTEPGRIGLAPGESRSSMVRLEAPMFLDGWRPFITAENTQGTSPEIFFAVRRRNGLGLQFQGPDDSFELQMIDQSGSLAGSSVSLRFSHSFNDQWSLALGGSLRAADTPLRAVANGIDMHSAFMGLDYNRDEGLSANLALQRHEFSDGNQRINGSVSLTQQLHASSVWRVFTRQEVYASRNSSNAGPYFSPIRDLSVSVSLISQSIWLRTPRRMWSDRLELQAGKYHQFGYSNQTIHAVSYEQTFSPSPSLAFSGGLTFSQRYYDGAPQRSTVGHLRMDARF